MNIMHGTNSEPIEIGGLSKDKKIKKRRWLRRHLLFYHHPFLSL